MRTRKHERDAEVATAEPSPERAGFKGGHCPIRTCILTREEGARDDLIRLALSPDGEVLPDVRGRAPGRGAWIAVDRAELQPAIYKGRLPGAFARAYKGAPLRVPDDLAQRIEDGLARACRDRLGLEARAGTLIAGSERIDVAARRGGVYLLLHASDAAEDGNRKLDQAWRVGGGAGRGLVIPADRTTLSVALGRENVVHIALVDRGAAARVARALDRWRAFIGWDSGRPAQDALPDRTLIEQGTE